MVTVRRKARSVSPPKRQARGDERGSEAPIDIDAKVAHASRVYDYLVGGRNNFAVDRDAAEQMAASLPGGIDSARAGARTNRIFLGQAVRWLAGEQGIRQFLDIGSGIPTVRQTHEVAQAVSPEARVVYVDNDAMVLAHAHTLLRSSGEGDTVFLREDLRNPEAIVTRAAETLDLTRPVGLVLAAIYHMLPDSDRPYEVQATLVDALASGSYVVLSHLTADFMADEMSAAIERLSHRTRERFVNRTREEVARFLDGLEPVEPGIAQIDEWLRRGPSPPPPDVQPTLPEDLDPRWINPLWAAVARKP